MSAKVKTQARRRFRTNLDGEIQNLPGRSLRSLLGIFAHLENVASRQEKGLSLLSRNAIGTAAVSMTSASATEQSNYRDFGRQVIAAAKRQVEVLQTRLHRVQSLVLINEWTVAGRLWSELLLDCKTPLFELNLLEELWGINPDEMEIGGFPLTRHWHQFVLIQANVEFLLARRRSLLELSDTLERDLGQWLKRFGEIWDALDEASLA
jgi:hypothetical protein